MSIAWGDVADEYIRAWQARDEEDYIPQETRHGGAVPPAVLRRMSLLEQENTALRGEVKVLRLRRRPGALVAWWAAVCLWATGVGR